VILNRLVLIFFLLPSAALGNAMDACDEFLRRHEDPYKISLQSTGEFRNEIKLANDEYKQSYPRSAISMLRGGESKLLKTSYIPDGHMIYLGSGADVYRPLYDFPYIQHYHLVDTLTGWGKNPKMVLTEIMRRLSKLAAGARVLELDRGFLNSLTEAELQNEMRSKDESHEFIEKVLSRSSQPLILLVEWESRTSGLHKKKFYVHAKDFHDFDGMKVMIDSMGSEPLIGILASGVDTFPSVNVFNMMMDRLMGAGRFIFEMLDDIGASEKYENELRTVFGRPYRVQVSVPEGEMKLNHVNPNAKDKSFFELLISNPPMIPL
jgi:hypothetical protein